MIRRIRKPSSHQKNKVIFCLYLLLHIANLETGSDKEHIASRVKFRFEFQIGYSNYAFDCWLKNESLFHISVAKIIKRAIKYRKVLKLKSKGAIFILTIFVVFVEMINLSFQTFWSFFAQLFFKIKATKSTKIWINLSKNLFVFLSIGGHS